MRFRCTSAFFHNPCVRAVKLKHSVSGKLAKCGVAMRICRITTATLMATAVTLGLTLTSAPSLAHEPISRSVYGSARVVDGDTLVVSGHRVRLKAIDAPEISQKCVELSSHHKRACGVDAKIAMQGLVDQAHGFVECFGARQDQYGRLVAVCTANHHDIGAALVSQGYAVAYRQYGHDYVSLEENAKHSKRCGFSSDITFHSSSIFLFISLRLLMSLTSDTLFHFFSC